MAQHSITYQTALSRSSELELAITADPIRFRVLTGDRPTGDLHLGHYLGSIRNRVRLQNLGVNTRILIADMQVITDRERPGDVVASVYSLLADQLASGLDPAKTSFFTHSSVPALNQLMVFLLSLTSEAELRRNPTVKAELEASARPMSGLLLTYPVHQAADILFGDANLVPGGRDQLPHVETARLLAQRFNGRYGAPVFIEPETLLAKTDLLLGLDGKKMSKSRGNTVKISATAEETERLIRKAVTDADPQVSYDPVNRPEVSNLVTIAAAFLDMSPQQLLETHHPYGGRELKELVTSAVNESLAGIRARRAELVQDRTYLRRILVQGNLQANEVAEAKLGQVREALGFSY